MKRTNEKKKKQWFGWIARIMAVVTIAGSLYTYPDMLTANAAEKPIALAPDYTVSVSDLIVKDEPEKETKDSTLITEDGTVSDSDVIADEDDTVSGNDGTKDDVTDDDTVSGSDGTKDDVTGDDTVSGSDGVLEDDTVSGSDAVLEDDTVSGSDAVSSNDLLMGTYELTDEAGKEDITLTITAPTGEIVRNGEKISLALGYALGFDTTNTKKLKSSYTLSFPSNIEAEQESIGNIKVNGDIVGCASYKGNSLEVRFDIDAEDNSLTDDDGMLKVNILSSPTDTERKYKNIWCRFENIATTYTPKDNSGSETLQYQYADSGDSTKQNWDTLPITYTPQKKDMTITQTCVKQETGSHAGKYKCTTTVIPGNKTDERKESITLVQELKDFLLDDTTPPSLLVTDKDGTKITTKSKDSISSGGVDGYTYETSKDSTSGIVTGHIAYKIDDFAMSTTETPVDNPYAEDDKLVFTYYVKENPEIYSQTEERILTSKGGVFDSTQFIKWNTTTGNIGGMKSGGDVSIKPNPLSYGYEIKEDKGKKYLEWTVKVNNDKIDMYHPILTINVSDKDKNYLTIAKTKTTDTGFATDSWVYSEDTNTSDKTGMVGTGSSPQSTPQTIIFCTDITDKFYEEHGGAYEFKVDVNLEWKYANSGEEGTSSGGKWNEEIEQPIWSDDLVQKTGSANSSDGTVTWEFTVNSPKLALTNVEVTDEFQKGLTVDSVKEQGKTNALTEGTEEGQYQISNNTGTNRQTLTIHTGNLQDKSTVKYTVVTKVPDTGAADVKYKNDKTTYENTAKITASNGSVSINKEHKAPNVNYKSELFKKEGKYNKNEHDLEWKITFNTSKTSFTNAQIADTIPAGLAYDSAAGVKIQKNGTDYSGLDSKITASANSILINFSDETTTGNTYVITYHTTITDPSLFDKNNGTNGSKVTNKAVLTSTETPIPGITETKDVAIVVDVITKEKIVAKQTYSQWKVVVNNDFQDLRGAAGNSATAAISDVYKACKMNGTELAEDKITMQLRPSDMVLTAKFADNSTENMSVLPSGTSGQVAIVTYDKAGEFSVSLPIQKEAKYATAQYTLTYKIRTSDIAAEITEFQIKNTATFTCDRGRDVPAQTSGEKTSSKISVGSISGGGTEDPDGRTLTVTKKDAATGAKLAGATFELSGIYGVEQTITTGADGTAVFHNLSKTLAYTLKEISAPNGYVLPSPNEWTYVAGDADLTEAVTNEKAKGSFSFTKQGQKIQGSGFTYAPLAGAEFTLYEGSGDSATSYTATSAADGKVVFQEIPFGIYNIRETTAPADYKQSADKVKVVFTQNGTNSPDLTAVLSGSGDFSEADKIWKNQLTTRDVTVKLKKDSGTAEAITGTNAPGTRYYLTDTAGNVIAEKTVEATDTEVVFADVPNGAWQLRMDGILDKLLVTYEDPQKHIVASAIGSTGNQTVIVPAVSAANKVTVTVVDKDSPSKKLPNCRVNVWRHRNGTMPYLMYSGTTDANGQVMTFLPDTAVGETYSIEQFDAVGNYIKDTGTHQFTLAATGGTGEEKSFTFYDPLKPPSSGGSSGGGSSSDDDDDDDDVKTVKAVTLQPTVPADSFGWLFGTGDAAAPANGGQGTNGGRQLPKTGGFWDFTTLAGAGLLLILAGGALEYAGRRKKRCGTKQEES